MKDLGDDNRVHLGESTHIDYSRPRPNQLARPGDIIFRSRGQTNTAALLQEDTENTIVAAPLFRVRPDTEMIIPEFLLWWINQPLSQSYLASRSKGTMVKMVSKQSLEGLEVSLPSLKQQTKIVAFLRLSMREQQLLEEIKNRKAIHTQGILMQMVSQSCGAARNKKPGFNVTVFTTGSNSINSREPITMKRGKNQHVVKHPDGWAVKGEGNSRATKVTDTQQEAIEHAEQIARNQQSDTKIHDRNGKIRAGNSYGNDPYPPKDRK